MTEFNDADLRRKTFFDALDTYESAADACKRLKNLAQVAVDALAKVTKAPISVERMRQSPPPMPTPAPRHFKFPTEDEINAAIAARDAARVDLINAWDALTITEQSRQNPPQELALQIKRP